MGGGVLMLLLLATVGCSKVIYVAGAYRHGARAPMSPNTWNEHHYQSGQWGNLTKNGIQQHRDIGTAVRRKYGKKHALFDMDFNPEQIKVRSTNTKRTIQSVLEQIIAIFPHVKYAIDEEYGPHLLDDSQSYPLDFHTLVNGQNVMLQGYRRENCPRMSLFNRHVASHPGFKLLEQEAIDQFLPVLSMYTKNISNIKELSNLTNSLKCDVAEGIELPKDLQAIYEPLVWWEALYRYRVPFEDPQALRLACSEFIRTLLQEMNAALKGSKLKLSLFSTHEMSIGAFLKCLDLSPQTIPNFAASLFFELHDSERVIVIYENVHQRLSFCPEPCSFSQFEVYLHHFLVDDIHAECALDEGWESQVGVSYYS